MSEDNNNKKKRQEEKAFPFIEGENLNLVPSHPDWNELYCKWSNDPEVRVFARNVMPNTIEDTKKWLKPREEKGAPDHIVMTIWHKTDRKPIGVIGLGDINWFNRWANAFIQIGDKDYWKKGIATEATKLLLKYAFEEVNLNKVSGGVIVENIGSWKVAEKVGFKFEAILKKEFYVNGKYHDVKRYGYLREDWFKTPKSF